jgi:hypothetical protein
MVIGAAVGRTIGRPIGRVAGAGDIYDVNFSLGYLPPNITFTRASSATYFDANGDLQTAAENEPRFENGALKLETDARRNSLRNNTMQGASAPSTLPTNWAIIVAGGLTTTVVGTGTERGLPYIDIQIAGTPSGSSYQIATETNSAIPASSGQTWTSSYYVSRVAGANTNISSLNIRTEVVGGTGATSTNYLSGLSSTLTRVSNTVTTGGSVTAVRTLTTFGLTSGQAIDITLRIAAPQTEQGAFASSVILTSGSAAERAADVAAISNLASIGFNPLEGTFRIGMSFAGLTSGAVHPITELSDGTSNNVMTFRRTSFENRWQLLVVDGGSNQMTNTGDIPVVNTAYDVVWAYKADDCAWSVDGGAAVTDTSVVLPDVDRLTIGGDTGGTQFFFGHISRIAYYPQRGAILS